jgi:trk system potassium uptake protein TrkH
LPPHDPPAVSAPRSERVELAGRARAQVPVALGAAASLCLLVELGWALGPVWAGVVHGAEWLVALAYAALLLREQREDAARAAAGGAAPRRARRAVTYTFVGLVAVAALAALFVTLANGNGDLAHPSRVTARIFSTAVAGLVALRSIGDLVRLHDRLLERATRAELFLVGGFLGLVVLGTALLVLPRMSTGAPLSFIDALFTATSASCVTGLAVCDTGTDLTLRGQSVLLVLFQLGGLGIVTFTAFGAVLAGRQFSVHHLVRMRTFMQVETPADVRRQVLFLVLTALVVELVGALLLLATLPADADLQGGRAWWALFHSVSAFCNAGFGLEADSLVAFRANFGVNAIIAGLFVVGGLGAPVVREVLRVALARAKQLRTPQRARRFVPPLSIQARLALVPTLVLLPLGALLFWLMERNGVLAGLGAGEAALASAFQSATPRTAGFATVDFGALTDATLLFTTGLMVVGASPMSTGGGIKTATLFVLLLTLRAATTGRDEVEFRGRVVARTAVRTALSVVMLYVATAASGVLVLSLTDPQIALRDRVFEAVSALSTTGLSTGVTASWSDGGKLVLCLLMFMGRVGPATLMLAAFRPGRERVQYRYPTDSVILG